MIISRYKLVALVIALTSLPVSSVAQDLGITCYYTGQQLASDCRAKQTDERYWTRQQICLSYISGVVDAYELMIKFHEDSPKFCMPRATTKGEIKDLVTAELVKYKSALGVMGSFYVVNALKNAFPCKKEEK